MDLTKAEIAMLVLIVKLRVIELREADKYFHDEMNLLLKLEEIDSTK